MFLIDSLQYITLHTSKMQQMYDYYVKILGLVKLEGSLDDVIYLAVNENKPAVILRKAAHSSVGEVGYNVKENAWGEIIARMSAQGIFYQEEYVEFFGNTLSFSDCDEHPIRVFLNQESNSVKGPSRFGPILSRFQHVTYASPHPKALAEFYQTILGFQVSDKVEGDMFIWLRTDIEHHTVAVAAHKKPGLDHYSFDLPNWGSFKEYCDFLGSKDIEVVWGPGRHGPGNNLFFFTVDPDGNRVEYSCEMEKFYDEYVTYQPRVWKKSSKTVNLWGQGAPWPRELP
jgi:catechol 2,3-dioxygenase-like lactoylglutathione lyase family enzyme